ncbi:MAG: DUF255 domain-containing protein [Coriobacteriia bacterium]|nr:DUF255 domain-containing protein [Coriobacteriia bacterium]
MPNRLADAASPYLRQHADDPVDWHPWGDEAFALAAELDRPVFLSCGYSACHWCHVMQRESFRDADTAALLNARFVSIKVDRELRPDVDALYMDYVAASTGSGGWPMTVFLTPGKLPLVAGTYFPKKARAGLPSFTDVLRSVDAAYRDDAARLADVAAQARDFLVARAAPRHAEPIDRPLIDAAASSLLKFADVVHGGFGGAPKFPQWPLLGFLAAYQRHSPEPDIEFVLELTLTAILRGGTFDQVGGGVHRYAVDADWRVPHFEKMLCDQGLLLSALAAAAPFATSDAIRAEYAHAARQTAAFLQRELSLPGGGFCASLSAEAGGEEGEPYEWTRAQLEAALDTADLAMAEAFLGAPAAGDTRALTLTRAGGREGDADALDAILLLLLAARQSRPHPDRDEKLLTGWNAIAARGLLDAARAFGDDAMASLGLNTALVCDRAAGDDGVVREPSDPSTAGVRLIEDAAHLVAALLTAAEVTGDESLRRRAEAVHADTLARFADGPRLFATAADTDLPVRPREEGDGAVPSGSSTVIENAVRLGAAGCGDAHLTFAGEALAEWWAVIDMSPEHAGSALSAALLLEDARDCGTTPQAP